MYPAVSVTYDGKVIVNLGKNLLHLPEGVFPLCPTAMDEERRSLEEAFSVYGSKNEEGEEVIAGQGLIHLATDLGSTGPLDPTLLILAWVLFSSRQWEFTKSEWLCSWSVQSVFSFDGIKLSMEKWRLLLKENEEIFRNFYQFVFEYLKQPKTTNIEKNEAIAAWKIVGIDKRWGIFDKWEKFWEENSAKVVTKDTWNMLVRFIEKMGTNVQNYDENDSWPLMLDEFVKEVMKKEC